jgi:hypothetical protein
VVQCFDLPVSRVREQLRREYDVRLLIRCDADGYFVPAPRPGARCVGLFVVSSPTGLIDAMPFHTRLGHCLDAVPHTPRSDAPASTRRRRLFRAE